jgi:valyl-tRNA synthetase
MTDSLLLDNDYPVGNEAMADAIADERMAVFQAVVTAARNIRAQYRVNPAVRIPLRVRTPADKQHLIEPGAAGIRQLAKVDELVIGPDVSKEKGCAATPIGEFEVVVPLAGVVNLEAEVRRLEGEKEKIERELKRVGAKLANERFITRANPDVVEKERGKHARLQSELEKLIESLAITRAE